MKFFIDTANLEQIQEAYDLGVLDGVTTNPSLMAKEGIKGTENQREHYIKICKIVNADVSAEVIATDYEGMIREGEELCRTKSAYCCKSALHCRWYQSYQVLYRKGNPDELYTGLFHRTGIAGGKSRSYLCFSFLSDVWTIFVKMG